MVARFARARNLGAQPREVVPLTVDHPEPIYSSVADTCAAIPEPTED